MSESLKDKLLRAGALGAVALGMALIVHFEGYESKPYRDVAGVLTVCYGHTGTDIVPDREYSKAECEELLQKDLAIVQRQVDKLVTVPISDAQRGALYSFTYNVGVGAFGRSTLLKKLNAGDRKGACDELKRWNKAGGKVWKGLVTRREVEKAVCMRSLK